MRGTTPRVVVVVVVMTLAEVEGVGGEVVGDVVGAVLVEVLVDNEEDIFGAGCGNVLDSLDVFAAMGMLRLHVF